MLAALAPADWAVIATALGAIAWVNWYFFLADAGSVVVKAVANGRQEVHIAVRGGYEPSTIRVAAGTPVRLVFDRQETSSCSEELVFPDFGVRRFLPAFEQTSIDITPPAKGTYEFTCGMSMLRGRVVAE